MKLPVRMLASVILAALPAVANAGNEGQLRPVLSCTRTDGSRITLEAESHGPDGDALFVQIRGKTVPAFPDISMNDAVGRIALAKCVSGTLIFALEYGTPYLKGVAIRQNPRTHADERLYFAEKALPRWLFVSDTEMLLVIPNVGYETTRKYLVYRYVGGKGQPEASTPTDRLPAGKRRLIRLD